MRILGKDMALYIDGDIVALSKTCNIEITADMTEVASPMHGRAKSFIPGRYSWQVTTEALVSSGEGGHYKLIDHIKKGTQVLVRVTSPDSPVLTGRAYVQSLRKSGAVGSMATYSATLIGDGELA